MLKPVIFSIVCAFCQLAVMAQSSLPKPAGVSASAQCDHCQAKWSFKGDYLGMTLAEFKQVADHYPFWIQMMEPDAKGHNHKVKLQLTTPLCTDQYPVFRGSEVPEPLDGEVVCDDAPEGTVIPRPIVAGNQMNFIKYRFYKDRLYEIVMVFPSSAFADLSEAFTEKYGASSETQSTSYENGFGARWTGKELLWKDNPFLMILREGSGNGPGQSSATAHPGAMIMSDTRVGRNRDRSQADVDF